MSTVTIASPIHREVETARHACAEGLLNERSMYVHDPSPPDNYLDA
jgi:hypothetical protein